jgi:general secretion pathway protein E
MVAIFKESIEDSVIREAAIRGGMRSLQEQLKSLIIEGETSMDEAIRIGIKG